MSKNKQTIAVDKRNRSLKKISVISAILFIVAILAFNILFDTLLGSKLKWDWSTGNLYTIGDISKGILKNLTQDVQIIGLFDKENDTSYIDIRKMLDDYAANSDGHITLRYVDPDINPAIKTEIDPENYINYETAVFVVYSPSTKKTKAITYAETVDIQYDQYSQPYVAGNRNPAAELNFTGAIKYVINEITPTLYFTSGHNELNYESDYSQLVSIIQSNNFDVQPLNLFGATTIPTDCAVLIMAEPKTDISLTEKDLISTYLKTGGSLMVLAGFDNVKFPVLNQLLADYNLEIGNSKIREGDINYRLLNDEYFLRVIAPVSTFTNEVIDGQIAMENTRGMTILTNTSDKITTEAILTTSDQGIADLDGDVNQASAPATQNVAVLSVNQSWVDGAKVTQSAQVLLFGSSSMFSDSMLDTFPNSLNSAMFYFSVQVLSNIESADNLMIEPKDPISYNLTSGTLGDWNLAAFFCFLILPVILLIIALVVYRKRKNL